MTQREAAKPCPFCGSADISDGEVLTEYPNKGTSTQSQCRGCGALGPEARLNDNEVDYGSVKAAAAWNRRPADMVYVPRYLVENHLRITEVPRFKRILEECLKGEYRAMLSAKD